MFFVRFLSALVFVKKRLELIKFPKYSIFTEYCVWIIECSHNVSFNYPGVITRSFLHLYNYSIRTYAFHSLYNKLLSYNNSLLSFLRRPHHRLGGNGNYFFLNGVSLFSFFTYFHMCPPGIYFIRCKSPILFGTSFCFYRVATWTEYLEII